MRTADVNMSMIAGRATVREAGEEEASSVSKMVSKMERRASREGGEADEQLYLMPSGRQAAFLCSLPFSWARITPACQHAAEAQRSAKCVNSRLPWSCRWHARVNSHQLSQHCTRARRKAVRHTTRSKAYPRHLFSSCRGALQPPHASLAAASPMNSDRSVNVPGT